MQPIKAIIFDLGGVFLNIDYPATRQAFIDLGIGQFDELFSQHHANDLFEQLETGKISPAAFYDAFRRETGLELSDEAIRTAWNAMLLDFPPERLQWLEQVATRYPVYLFSNTNQIHYDAFIETFRSQTGKPDFNAYFVKAHYSHELGLRKPYPEAFTALLRLHGLDAATTVFIDDTWKNIEGARAAGLQTIYLEPPQTVLDLAL